MKIETPQILFYALWESCKHMNINFYFVWPSGIYLIQLTIDIDYQLLYNKIHFGTLPAPPWVSQKIYDSSSKFGLDEYNLE